MIEALNVQAVFADRWNSLKLLHDIEAKYGIVAEQYSIKYRDFTTIRSYMEDCDVIVRKVNSDTRSQFKVQPIGPSVQK